MTKRQLEALLQLLDNRDELHKIVMGDEEAAYWHPLYIKEMRESIPKLTAIITQTED